jgi:hypothetical protein
MHARQSKSPNPIYSAQLMVLKALFKKVTGKDLSPSAKPKLHPYGVAAKDILPTTIDALAWTIADPK